MRTITGVATSITAFIGRAVMGPVDTPVTINSFEDFQRQFGGLHAQHPMSYCVHDFYQNGGRQAIIVRLYKKPPGSPSKALIKIPNLNLDAASEGSWANPLRARVDNKVSPKIAMQYGLDTTDLFNLTVRNIVTGAQETFFNLTVKDSPHRADRILVASSALVRTHDAFPGTTAPTAHGHAGAKKAIWEDDSASTGVAVAEHAADSAALSSKTDFVGDQVKKTGMYALNKTDLFNLLCVPPDSRGGDTPADVYQEAMTFCVARRAMLIVDAPHDWTGADDITKNNNKKLSDLGLNGDAARNAALFFPRVFESDPLQNSIIDTFVPCGLVAGVIARTDAQRGVWEAPAGIDAALCGTAGLAVDLTDDENGMLNSLGINCLRSFPVPGRIVWGARTLRGADLLADEYKYVPVRRLALFIEESLYRGTQWVVFEPNDEPLWSQIRLNVGAFMQSLFRRGAFQGSSPRDAYFVKCSSETTTQTDIDNGIVNIIVGFAPLKPDEFIIIKIQQIAQQP